MTQPTKNSLGARAKFDTGNGNAYIYRLDKLDKEGWGNISRLPFSIKVLLEAVLREVDGYVVTEDNVQKLAGWHAASPAPAQYNLNSVQEKIDIHVDRSHRSGWPGGLADPQCQAFGTNTCTDLDALDPG